MRPISRPRILVVSSDAALRQRIAAVLAARYQVMSCGGWGAAAQFEDIALAVVSERDHNHTGGFWAACPVLSVRESCEAAELLERIEMRLELSRLRSIEADLRRQEQEQTLILDT